MSSTISPNMNLVIPGVGTEAGPTYAFDVNSSLTLVDQHDHSPGSGVQITPAGLNINVDLDFNNNAVSNVKEIVFATQSANTTLQSLYVLPGAETPLTNDLWFNDGNGIAVQITTGGLVNATIASLPGESYAAGTFTWRQGALSTVPANFDIGSITIRPNDPATTNGVRINPPGSITSQYDIQLPLLPASTLPMLLDVSGNITTAQITGSQIAPVTIQNSNIVNATITGAKIAANTIGLSNLDTTVLTWKSSIFTANGTFVAPTGVNQVFIHGVGGGGGGSFATVGGGVGAGGAGGGGSVPQLVTVTVVPGNSYAVVIGAGGTVGANGGTSSFGTLPTGPQFLGGRAAVGAGYSWFNNIGGVGGAQSPAAVGQTGTASIFANGGTGGSTSGGGGGGGGGGGSSFGQGGTGGAATGSAIGGTGGVGAGGGGGGSVGVGGSGGPGGRGEIRVYWLGNP